MSSSSLSLKPFKTNNIYCIAEYLYDVLHSFFPKHSSMLKQRNHLDMNNKYIAKAWFHRTAPKKPWRDVESSYPLGN